MKFRTKVHEVRAISVERIVNVANEDFNKLPAWIKEQYQNSKLFIGSCSVVFDDVCLSGKEDIILIDDSQKLMVMARDQFFECYEDALCPENKIIV